MSQYPTHRQLGEHGRLADAGGAYESHTAAGFQPAIARHQQILRQTREREAPALSEIDFLIELADDVVGEVLCDADLGQLAQQLGVHGSAARAVVPGELRELCLEYAPQRLQFLPHYVRGSLRRLGLWL